MVFGKVAFLFSSQMLAPEIIKGKARNTPGLTKYVNLTLYSVLGLMLDLESEVYVRILLFTPFDCENSEIRRYIF